MTTNNDYLNTQRETEVSNEIDAAKGSLLVPAAAGLGAIALGWKIFGKGSGSVVADMLHFLGHPNAVGLSQTIDDITKTIKGKGSPQTTRSLSSSQFDVVHNKLRLGPISLIDDLRNSLEILGGTRIDVAQQIAARTTEHINRETTKYGPFSSFFGPNLKRVTASDVFADSARWRQMIGDSEFNVLERSRQLGLISANTVIDKNLLRDSVGGVRDVRLSSIFRTGREGGLVGRITGGLDLFGQAGVIRSIIGSKTSVAALGPADHIKGNRFFVGGSVYAYDKYGTQRVLATNQKLRLAGDPLDAVTAARQGTLRISKEKLRQAYAHRGMPKELSEALIEIEAKTGVGLGFSSRPSIIDRYITNPILRYKALASGRGTVYRHKYVVEGQASKVLDAAVGADMPELMSNRGTIKQVIGGGNAVDWSSLSIVDKIAAVFDLKSGVSVVKATSYNKMKTGPYRYTMSNKDLVVPVPEGGTENLTKSIVGRLADSITHAQSGIVTQAGDFINVKRPKYYAVGHKSNILNKEIPAITSIADVANYMFHRVNTLASETLLGIGFAPGKTALGSAARLASIPFIYEAGREAIEYADYLSEKIMGVSPIKLGASIYATARVAQQKIRETIGIQQSLAWLETNFPGSVESEGASIIRSIAAPLAMAIGGIGKANPTLGLIAAGLSYLAIGGPSPGQSSAELQEEYEGKRKVPVRKGRYWGGGLTPLGGSQPEYYDYSWYYKVKTDLDYKAGYGSKDEYFAYHQNVFGVPLPTPTNYFGLANIANPYRWDDMNYADRPYVQTGSPLENFPIFGPILGATVGRALKPTRYRNLELPLLKAGVVDKGLQPGTAEMLGIPAMAASEQYVEDPNEPIERLRKMGDVALEPFGIYKFVMEYFGVKLTPSGGPRYASSDLATSEGKEFYGRSLGGFGYQTELIRRFMLSEYYSPHNLQRLENPIRNTMPTFLPGSASDNAKDRAYMKDFHMGDPALTIPKGEYRLPGKLYESMNELHSNEAGVYDYLDQFLILADVAPYSDSYRRLEKRVKEDIKTGALSPEWQAKAEQAISQRKQVIGVDDRYLRAEDELIDINQGIKSEAMHSARKAYDFLTHDILAEIPYVGSKLFPFRNPYEQYRKTQVEGSEYADWDRPYESILRPMYYDMALEDPLTAGMKGGILGALMYGPMRFFVPFKGLQSNLSSSVLFGSLGGAAVSSNRILSGREENYIPQHVREESEFNQYVDKFNYLKARMYEEEAEGIGASSAASQFRKLQKRTMVGANNSIMMKAALPRSVDRRYFDYFLNASESSRSQILEGIPQHMSEALTKSYNKDFASKDQADAETLAYFSENPLPSPEFMGWHPGIPAQATKMKLVDIGLNGVSNNFHRHGFFESQEYELKYRMPDLYNQQVTFNPPINFRSISETSNLADRVKDSIQPSISSTAFSARNQVYISRHKTYYLEDLMRQ